MSNATQTMPAHETQAVQNENTDAARARRVFMPRADIYETPDSVVVIADMPGVDEKSVDLSIEKNVLTITARVEGAAAPNGLRLAYEEYETGDYQRAFTISDEIDRDRIEASVKQGVLKVLLPKSTLAKSRKISVKAE